MKTKNIIYTALAVLVLTGTVYYITSNKARTAVQKVDNQQESIKNVDVEKVVVSKDSNKTSKKEVNTTKETKKVETEKEFNPKEGKEIAEIVKSEIKKPFEERISIYKEYPNLDFNMVLKVPEKWQHLDYSKLGNPKEVEVPKELWAPGCELYSKDDSRYERTLRSVDENGKVWKSDSGLYLSQRHEAKLLEIFTDREAISEVILDNKLKNKLFKNKMNDINKFIYINEKTGRKTYIDEKITKVDVGPTILWTPDYDSEKADLGLYLLDKSTKCGGDPAYYDCYQKDVDYSNNEYFDLPYSSDKVKLFKKEDKIKLLKKIDKYNQIILEAYSPYCLSKKEQENYPLQYLLKK